ncbi:MAG: holo-ACP synthase [Alphaproteobacteria bacterium]
MILATGIDLTDIRRIEQTLARFGAQFENRVFTKAEQEKAKSRAEAGIQTVAATYAKRFAAKEACIKALGMKGINWLDMEVSNADNGAPSLTLHGEAKQYLQRLTPEGHRPVLFLSLTDAYPYAQAQLIIEAQRP